MCLLTACSSSKKSSGDATNNNITSDTRGNSYENAIVIDEESESSGVKAEYTWLRKNYPGYKLIQQTLGRQGGKIYDKISIKTASGKKKTIYFDITNFFGKY